MEPIKLSKNPLLYQIALSILFCLVASLVIKKLVDKDFIDAFTNSFGLVLPILFLPFMKAKMVVYKDNFITVSSLVKKEIISVEKIKNVSLVGKGNRMRVLIELAEGGSFGTNFSFIPKNELKIPSDKTVGIQIAPGIIITKY